MIKEFKAILRFLTAVKNVVYKFMELDVVLLPPKKLSRQIGNIASAAGKKYAFSVVVDDKKLLPHISLLHLKSNQAKLPGIVSALKAISQKHRKFGLSFGSAFERSLFFHYKISNPVKLYRLHKEIVETISRFRTGIVWLPKISENQIQRKYFKLYGVGIVVKYFDPHFTLGRLKNPVNKNAAMKFLNSQSLLEFTVDRLAFAQVNRYHQVIKIIKEFKLK